MDLALGLYILKLISEDSKECFDNLTGSIRESNAGKMLVMYD